MVIFEEVSYNKCMKCKHADSCENAKPPCYKPKKSANFQSLSSKTPIMGVTDQAIGFMEVSDDSDQK